MKKYWIIDDDCSMTEFEDLWHAKEHVRFDEKPGDTFISHVVNGEIVSFVDVTVKNGKIHFGRIVKA